MDGRLYDTGTAITPIVLPQAAGGDGAMRYALSLGTLPQGLTWTASTRTIAGTLTRATDSTTYSWKATDADGDSATLTFALRVWAPTGPAISDAGLLTADADDNFQAGDRIEFQLTWPERVVVTGGGTPQLALVIGGNTRKANYNPERSLAAGLNSPGGARNRLVFDYTVRADDFDGISLKLRMNW